MISSATEYDSIFDLEAHRVGRGPQPPSEPSPRARAWFPTRRYRWNPAGEPPVRVLCFTINKYNITQHTCRIRLTVPCAIWVRELGRCSGLFSAFRWVFARYCEGGIDYVNTENLIAPLVKRPEYRVACTRFPYLGQHAWFFSYVRGNGCFVGFTSPRQRPLRFVR